MLQTEERITHLCTSFQHGLTSHSCGQTGNRCGSWFCPLLFLPPLLLPVSDHSALRSDGPGPLQFHFCHHIPGGANRGMMVARDFGAHINFFVVSTNPTFLFYFIR